MSQRQSAKLPTSVDTFLSSSDLLTQEQLDGESQERCLAKTESLQVCSETRKCGKHLARRRSHTWKSPFEKPRDKGLFIHKCFVEKSLGALIMNSILTLISGTKSERFETFATKVKPYEISIHPESTAVATSGMFVQDEAS